jgi:ribA/ribD-fused uncharacterized protein
MAKRTRRRVSRKRNTSRKYSKKRYSKKRYSKRYSKRVYRKRYSKKKRYQKGGITVPQHAARMRNPIWAGKSEHEGKCMLCSKEIGSAWYVGSPNQHHCRRCGIAVCDECSQNTATLDKWLSGSGKPHTLHTEQSAEPLRVCNLCNRSLSAAQPRPAAVPAPTPSQPNVDFYKGDKSVQFSEDGGGNSQTLTKTGFLLLFAHPSPGNYRLLENWHNYIQWIFPTTAQSRYNLTSHPLTATEIDIFKNDSGIQTDLVKSFVIIADFYGWLVHNGAVRIQDQNHYKNRMKAINTKDNHNFKRISRILQCLGLVGLDLYRDSFMDALKAAVEDGSLSAATQSNEHAPPRTEGWFTIWKEITGRYPKPGGSGAAAPASAGAAAGAAAGDNRKYYSINATRGKDAYTDRANGIINVARSSGEKSVPVKNSWGNFEVRFGENGNKEWGNLAHDLRTNTAIWQVNLGNKNTRVVGEYPDQSTVASGGQAGAAGGPKLTVPLDERPYGAHLPQEIQFYESHDDFYEFTNFWECNGLMIDGKQWRTTEHYFQAQKFVARPDLVEHCRNLGTPRECFEMKEDPRYKPLVREDWHRQLPTKNDPSIKDQVMYNAVMHKFNDDPTLKKLLLSTAAGGARVLIEQTHKDDYWGTGPGVTHEWARNKNVAYTGPWRPGMSGNNLGLLLMRIRDEINADTLHGGGVGYVVPAPQALSGQMCQFCNAKPANPGHPYCGRTCAQQAGARQSQPAAGGYAPHPAAQDLLTVKCPHDAGPGAQVLLTLTDGRKLEVIVPDGVQSGDMFQVSIMIGS